MHELTVVDALVKQVEAEAERLGLTGKVRAVRIKLGALTTLVPAAMAFYFGALTKGTSLEGARLMVDEVPVAGACRACGGAFTLEAPPFCCPACGSPDVELTAGRELTLAALDVEDDEA